MSSADRSNTTDTTDEHVITVEATRVFRGSVDVEGAERLTQDATTRNIYGTEYERVGVPMELAKETKRTYECSCGQRFRKGSTARKHLELANKQTDS